MTRDRSAILAYLGNSLFNSPLFAVYTLLAFILCKDLHATPFQITLMVSIKPIVAIPSFYWSSLTSQRKVSLKNSLLVVTLLGIFPSLLFPLMRSNGWYIFALAAFFFAERAAIPAWMEVLKVNVSQQKLGKIVGRSSLINFLAASILPVLIGPALDHQIGMWKWFFFGAACFSLLRLALLARLASTSSHSPLSPQPQANVLTHPWRECYAVLRKRPDFAFYQLIFFCGGLGIMLTQAALPKFVEGVLHLTYTEVALAIALCKGIGFALTNPLWSRWIYRVDLYRFCGVVTAAASLSLFTVLASPYWGGAIYLAFIIYGVMQAGSQLSWQLAGPIFAKSEDSTPYTGVNVFMVGLRGFIGPWVGRLIWLSAGLSVPFYIGGIVCLAGASFGLLGSRLFGQTPALERPAS